MNRGPAALTAIAVAVGAAVFAAGRPHHLGMVRVVSLSAAMSPAVPVNRVVWVDRDAYREGRAPARGDIVAVLPVPQVRAACGSTGYPLPPLLLRVAGVPGERVAVRAGRALVDGRPAHPPGVRLDTVRYDRDFGTVPAGTVLLLGDNRPQSCDARVWAAAGTAFTPVGALLGRVERGG